MAVALIATPILENLKIKRKIIVAMTAKIKPHKSPEGTTEKPRFRGFGGKISGKLRKEGVQIIYMTPLRITPRPIVTIITEIIGSPIRGLNIRRSITKPRANARKRVRMNAR
ncbi:unnamed protein product [marine sediment metagenome]|uniref:Uncharacterized protein n=1 Tax=marine sediment metagenome TaxID=412755 RepID=X0YKA2_9ZZZZ